MTEKNKIIKVMTPPFRVSFPSVFEATSMSEDQEKKYSVQMLFPKKFEDYPKKLQDMIEKGKMHKDLSVLKKAIAKACETQWGEKSKWPKFKHKVIKDGEEKADEKGLENYRGMNFVNAKSKTRPGVVDGEMNEIIDQEAFYAGCWARATVTVFTYDNKFGKGASIGLQNLQFLLDDDSFSGKANAKDDFEAVDFVSEDAFETSEEEFDF